MATTSDCSPATNGKFLFRGHPVPDELVGQFQDSSDVDDPRQLQRRLADSGYVFLRGMLDKDEVLKARQEVLARLVEVDEIKPPAIEAIATGRSQRREIAGDLIEFWRSVSEGPALRKVSHGPRVRAMMQTISANRHAPRLPLVASSRGR